MKLNIDFNNIRDGYLGLDINKLKNKEQLTQSEKDALLGWFAETGDFKNTKLMLDNNANPLVYDCGCYRWSKLNNHKVVCNYLKEKILGRISEEEFNYYIEENRAI